MRVFFISASSSGSSNSLIGMIDLRGWSITVIPHAWPCWVQELGPARRVIPCGVRDDFRIELKVWDHCLSETRPKSLSISCGSNAFENAIP